MENMARYSFFTDGVTDARVRRFLKVNAFKDCSIFYRLGCLYGISEKNPTRKRLITELFREFSFAKTELPNAAIICLNGHYSHRLLKRSFKYIGYSIPVRPSSTCFDAWRVR